MKKKILTIVVPSYNTKKYLEVCLPNMLDKRFLEDIEILLINDGSTDGTEIVLEKYAERFAESVRVINKENGGHGSVINRGIHEAKGKYFKVIDGDDTVETDSLEKFIRFLKKDVNVDMIIAPYYKEYIMDGKKQIEGIQKVETGKEFVFDDICKKIGYVPLHEIVYRTELLQKHEIKMQENCYYEDTEYNLYPIPYVRSLIYFDQPIYVYRIGVEGQSININSVIKNRKMLFKIVKNLCIFYEEKCRYNISGPKNKYIINAICEVAANAYAVYLKMPYGKKAKEMIPKFDKKLMQWSPKVYAAIDSKAIHLLRKDSFIIYTLAYFLFKLKRWKRGF